MRSVNSGSKTQGSTMKIAIGVLVVMSTISGCATCREHPVWCAVGSAVVVGSIAAVAEHHHDQQAHDRQIAPGGSPQCRSGVCPP
jgi:hypothetical protein